MAAPVRPAAALVGTRAGRAVQTLRRVDSLDAAAAQDRLSAVQKNAPRLSALQGEGARPPKLEAISRPGEGEAPGDWIHTRGLTRRMCTAVAGAGDRAALLRARAAMHQCMPAAVPRRHGARHEPGRELGAGTGAGACGP
jgi:hypothetical protein